MTRASKTFFGLITCVALSACAGGEGVNRADDSPEVILEDLSAGHAVKMFSSVCLDTQPSLAGAEVAITQLGFNPAVAISGVQLRTSPDFKVSFSVSSDLCTMIYWGSEVSSIDLELAQYGTPVRKGVFAFQGNSERLIKTITFMSPGSPKTATVTINSHQ